MKVNILIHWFAPNWPPWWEQWLQTLPINPEVTYTFLTNCSMPVSHPQVSIVPMDLEGFTGAVSQATGVDCSQKKGAISAVDLRPCLATTFPELVEGYDWWGWADLDIVVGSFEAFNVEKHVRQKKALIFTPAGHRKGRRPSWAGIYGSLALIKNTPQANELWDFPHYHRLMQRGWSGALIAINRRVIDLKIPCAAPRFEFCCTRRKPVYGKFDRQGRIRVRGNPYMVYHFRMPKRWPMLNEAVLTT